MVKNQQKMTDLENGAAQYARVEKQGWSNVSRPPKEVRDTLYGARNAEITTSYPCTVEKQAVHYTADWLNTPGAKRTNRMIIPYLSIMKLSIMETNRNTASNPRGFS